MATKEILVKKYVVLLSDGEREQLATLIWKGSSPARRLLKARHMLLLYMDYYNSARTHLSLYKDAPIPRAVQATGRIHPTPILGGLHHQYVRI